MSGVEPAVIAGLFGAASTAASVVNAGMQASAQNKATKQAAAEAKKTAELSAQEMRRQTSESADISSILEQNTDSLLSGGSTLLSGAGGAKASAGNLGGGNTLG